MSELVESPSCIRRSTVGAVAKSYVSDGLVALSSEIGCDGEDTDSRPLPKADTLLFALSGFFGRAATGKWLSPALLTAHDSWARFDPDADLRSKSAYSAIEVETCLFTRSTGRRWWSKGCTTIPTTGDGGGTARSPSGSRPSK